MASSLFIHEAVSVLRPPAYTVRPHVRALGKCPGFSLADCKSVPLLPVASSFSGMAAQTAPLIIYKPQSARLLAYSDMGSRLLGLGPEGDGSEEAALKLLTLFRSSLSHDGC